MPRGGPRNGTQGKAYSNRTDLGGQNVVQPQPAATGKVPIQTAPGQVQGAQTAQREAQQAVPMSGMPNFGTPAQGPVQSLFAETDRPDEPSTTGGLKGDGANYITSLPADPMAETDPSVQVIRALYMMNPRDEDLRMIVEELEKQGRV